MNALPNIWVTIRHCDPIDFLKYATDFATKDPRFVRVQAEYDFLGSGSHIVNIEPASHNSHEGLYGQLILYPTSKDRVHVEIRASRWWGGWPSRDEYSNRAKDIFKPIIVSFNRSRHQRLRIFVQNLASSKKVILAPGVRKIFERFTVLANIHSLHVLDWRRFYSFIWHCHSRQVKLTEDHVRALLVDAGFPMSKADELSQIYYHCRELLRERGGDHYH